MCKRLMVLRCFEIMLHRVLQDYNVPTLGHHCITECYDDQSSQMEVIASIGAIEGYFGVRLASLILFHHYDPFRTAWLWFRCIPTISMILSYFGL
jgi:hypothetical protein